ncbi:DUF2956 domain-containing protein [Thalassotalea piscium]
MNKKVSAVTQEQALKVAKGIQKKGQTKEQTKLIAQGIEKGIAEYKKQQSKKSRERDKQRKKSINIHHETRSEVEQETPERISFNLLPWCLLALSWIGFILFINIY